MLPPRFREVPKDMIEGFIMNLGRKESYWYGVLESSVSEGEIPPRGGRSTCVSLTGYTTTGFAEDIAGGLGTCKRCTVGSCGGATSSQTVRVWQFR